MESSAQDSGEVPRWEEYLEGLELLERLLQMQDGVLSVWGCAEELGQQEEDLEDVLESLEAKIERVQAWVEHAEEGLELQLQRCVEREERGREMFLRLAVQMRELRAAMPLGLAGLCGEDRAMWEGLVADFEQLRAVWRAKVPPEEWQD